MFFNLSLNYHFLIHILQRIIFQTKKSPMIELKLEISKFNTVRLRTYWD